MVPARLILSQVVLAIGDPRGASETMRSSGRSANCQGHAHETSPLQWRASTASGCRKES
jgi:hypothetical protein